MGGQRFALKMRRLDADRPSLEREAELLKKVNSIGVGPQFLAVSKDFLLMQLIDGCLIYDWLEDHKDKALIRHLLVDVLEQCWRLDEAGIDHGEISKAARHLLVDKSDKPFLVDFETASVTRSVINVTSLCQFLFQGNSDACISIAQTLGERNRIKLTEALKNYKKERNRSNFEAILMVALA
jgi:putative serine/threonine protein kinase